MSTKTLEKIAPALILMTRWPAPNRCKSRLSKDIGPIKAALIQRKLTEHTLAVVKAFEKNEFVEVFIAITGIKGKAIKRWGQIQKLKNINPQGEGNLGLRMRRQCLKVQTSKASRSIIIIGADLPSLSKRDLMEALEGLKTHQMVIGPSSDGGYWLLGLSGTLVEPIAIWPFINITWGSDKVFKNTIEQAKSAKINYLVLKEQNDLDQLKDLTPWNK